jgi:hypothetical protein
VKPASYLTTRILATLRKFVAQQPSHMTATQQEWLPWHPGLKAKSITKVSHEPPDRVDTSTSLIGWWYNCSLSGQSQTNETTHL